MKQAKNEVFIEGILAEVDIKTDTSKKDNKPYIRGEIKILVNQMIDGETKESVIPIRMFSMKNKKNGDANPAYDAILKVQNTFKSAAGEGGLKNADAVRVTRGSINENIFVPRGSDKEVSFPEIQANFISKCNRNSSNPLTRFSINVAINAIKEDVDREGVPTGALVIKAGVPQYADKLDLIEFKVYKDNAKEHIERYWQKGNTVNVEGYINFSAKTEFIEEEEESGFGDPISIPKTTTVRELVIISGSSEPFDEERSYSKEELNTGMDERIARIAILKDNSQKTAPAFNDTKKNSFDY